MNLTFKKATRQQSKLRLALIGVSGSGKTWTALTLAKYLGKRIAVIDSEHGSASLYAGDAAEFDVLNLETFAPRTYVEAIHAAEQEGYDVIVIDSLSHAWMGKDGALAMVDNAARRSKSGNSYTAWRDVTPEHNSLVDAMIRCSAHLIVTMRSKTEYVLQEGPNGKKTPEKIGMAPIQRDGLEYEFTLVGEMDLQHNLVVSKSRCSTLDNAVISRPGKNVAETLTKWLNEGAPMTERPAQEPTRPLDGDQPGTTRSTTSSTQTRGQTTRGMTSTPSSTRTGRPDEYGIATPVLGACPTVQSNGQWKGKRWEDLPGPLLEKMMAENGHKMSALQVEWGTYLLARRQARKAKEAREAEAAAAERALAEAKDTSSEGGGWVAGDDAPAGYDGPSDEPANEHATSDDSTEAA
jgi:hypothetical protein